MDDTELGNSLAALHAASYAWALVCCRDRELAEDVLQGVYAKLLDRRIRHDGRASFRTWLFAVIRNAARDERRKRWWSRVLRLDFEGLAELADATRARTASGLAEDEAASIRAAVDRLPERQRQVAHLIFYEVHTVAEAAQVMGVSVGAARQHYARAKQALTHLLEEWEPVR